MLPLAAVAAAAALLHVTRATLLQVCAIEVIQYPLPTDPAGDRNHLMINERVLTTLSGIQVI